MPLSPPPIDVAISRGDLPSFARKTSHDSLDAMKAPEALRQALKLLNRENDRLIKENLKLHRELVKLKRGDL